MILIYAILICLCPLVGLLTVELIPSPARFFLRAEPGKIEKPITIEAELIFEGRFSIPQVCCGHAYLEPVGVRA